MGADCHRGQTKGREWVSEQPTRVGYETESPNQYHWTQLAYEALTAGTMAAQIVGTEGARRATVSGPCPRCKHEVNFDQLLDAVAGEDGGLKTLGLEDEVDAPAYLELVVTCRCGEAHDNRPDGVQSGCGINFRADILDHR